MDQEIVKLIHWEGFSQVDVAQLLDRPPGTIRSRYARARTLLLATLTVEQTDALTPDGRHLI